MPVTAHQNPSWCAKPDARSRLSIVSTMRFCFTLFTASAVMYPGFTTSSSSRSSMAMASRIRPGFTAPPIVMGPTWLSV